jgi:hypothetical protein
MRIKCSVNVERGGSILIGKREGKRPLRRPNRRWLNNFKMDLRETGCGGLDCIYLGQDRDQRKVLVNTVMNLWFP